MFKYTARVLFISIIILSTAATTHAANPKFRRPLDTLLSPVYSAYYDNNTSSTAKNYYCGEDTVYNGHKGTDFRANIGTQIYSGASGGLYYRYDNCPTTGYAGSTCGGGYGNHVRIDHEGSETDGIGWITIYAHMKLGTVAWYQSLVCAAKIGQTGSSGNSTGPHLHFEVRKYGYPYDDPFSGTCGGPVSFWVNQGGGVPSTDCL